MNSKKLPQKDKIVNVHERFRSEKLYCGQCGKIIDYGELYTTITLSIEKVTKENEETIVDTYYSQELENFCVKCMILKPIIGVEEK